MRGHSGGSVTETGASAFTLNENRKSGSSSLPRPPQISPQYQGGTCFAPSPSEHRIYGYTFLLLGLLKVNGTMPNAGAGAQEPRVSLGTPAPLLIHGGLRLKLSQPQVPIQKKGDKISA